MQTPVYTSSPAEYYLRCENEIEGFDSGVNRAEAADIIMKALNSATSIIEDNDSLPSLGITMALGLTLLVLAPPLYILGLVAFAFITRH